MAVIPEGYIFNRSIKAVKELAVDHKHLHANYLYFILYLVAKYETNGLIKMVKRLLL